MSKLYALLVGINDYQAPMAKLEGCHNDIDNARDYLKTGFADAAVVVLKDGEATRANVIEQFRKHLGQAGRDDVAMFQYCGHGARSTAGPEFHQYDLDDRDAGLVLTDSRLSDDTYDLADKELALLISELAANDPHIAVIFDCCNSGSGTRSLEGGRDAGVRSTGGKFPPRPLETYLDGRYAAMLKDGGKLAIPSARHILMAACDRSQTAKEDIEFHKGYFTTALYDVLRKSGSDISYADLFVRSRAAVRQMVRDKGVSDQEPQFEPVAGFDAYAGFLGRAARASRKTYSVARGDSGWRVECGAIQGLPTDPAAPIKLTLHPEGDLETVAGTATATRVGAMTSEVALDFEADPIARYSAEVSSIPQAPMLVAFDGDVAARATVDAALAGNDEVNVVLVARGADDGFMIAAEGSALTLRQVDTGRMIKSVTIGSGDWARPMVAALGHVAQWRRSLALANPNPRLDPAKVEFVFAEQLAEGGEHVHAGSDLTVELRQVGETWPDVIGQLRLRNRTGQLLHYALVHFSADYGVSVVTNDQLVSSDDYLTILVPSSGGKPPSPDVYFGISRGDEAIEQLKVIISTERVDDFMLELAPLTDSRSFGSASDRPDEASKPITDDWFTKDLRVKIVRRLDQVGPAELSLADGQIMIEQHPSITANVSLSTAVGAARGGDGDDVAMARRLKAAGMHLLPLSGARGNSPNILELTDIGNAEALATAPISIRLNVPLGDGEAIVPMVHDGRHILLAGDSWLGEDGATHIRIDKLPGSAVGRRSLGGALKMYFFKTYWHSDSVNRLRWIEYGADGRYVAHDDGVAARVAAASNILLVIHGIIGDTAAMVAGIHASELNAKFDLVLSYDYENLATPIEQTAKLLQGDLARFGIRADDGKKFTIIAHSMGGLVSRRMIEREGGSDVVDHLVMCGTPNGGSPLGQVDSARQLLMMLATIGANFLPQVCAPALMLLTRSKKLTPTLEQMAPRSAFMAELNASPAPGVRYSILAGDVDRYKDADDQLFDELLVKTGRGPLFDALFSSGPNDIAVAVPSIFGEAVPALAQASHENVACHHLNYFSTAVGRDALKSIDWAS